MFDTRNDRYLLLAVGWDKRRVHGCIVHVDLSGGKFWIQRDGTEQGIARDPFGQSLPQLVRKGDKRGKKKDSDGTSNYHQSA